MSSESRDPRSVVTTAHFSADTAMRTVRLSTGPTSVELGERDVIVRLFADDVAALTRLRDVLTEEIDAQAGDVR